MNAPGQGGSFCLLPERPGPCVLVIFGGSGDLATRKLFPALARLASAHMLPEPLVILAVGRSALDDASFRLRLDAAFARAAEPERAAWEALAPRVFYCQADYASVSDMTALSLRLEALEARHGLDGDRLYYLAVPPGLIGTIAENLGRAGMAGGQWTSIGPRRRLVVEKPFGDDLDSARELNVRLRQWFEEEQIFRIDHYLAKETVQNIALLRFANAVLEPVWNRNYVEYVSILSAEDLGVENRAGYYDASGVLRDMFQNHMLQLMALAAMEPPSLFEAERVRDEKAKVFRSLQPFDPANRFRDLALGQYAAAEAGGRVLPAYREEPGIPPGSATPTFALLKLFVDNWRWQGVPFYLASGKRLARKLTRIVIQFKDAPHAMFRSAMSGPIEANRLIIEAAPGQAIHMSFQLKQPGPTLCLHSAALSHSLDSGALGPALEAYEKVLLDCMLGDRTLFLRQDAVELCWGFLTPILDLCASCSDMDRWLKPYAAGSWGPQEACAVHPQYLRDVADGQ